MTPEGRRALAKVRVHLWLAKLTWMHHGVAGRPGIHHAALGHEHRRRVVGMVLLWHVARSQVEGQVRVVELLLGA